MYLTIFLHLLGQITHALVGATAGATVWPCPTICPSGYTVPPPASNYTPGPNELLLGGLFPFTGALGVAGQEREAGARFAVDTINAQGTLLPGHTLKLITFDSETDQTQCIKLSLSYCDDYKALGVVGEASSADTAAAALITSISGTPQISYSSSASTLSDKTTYPTFFRTCPSDAYEANALLDITLRYGWKRVSLFHTIDVYGVSLEQSYSALAVANGITVAHDIPIQFTGTNDFILSDLNESMAVLDPSIDKVFFVMCTVQYAANVLWLASQKGLLTPEHQYIGTDGVVQASLLDQLASTFGSADLVGTNLTAAQKAMRYQYTKLASGVIGTGPALAQSPLATAFLNAWHSANASVYHNAGDPTRQINVFMPFAYDVIFTYANAMSNLLASGTPINRTTLLGALKVLNFTGVTGQITFDVNQDRIGAGYNVFNFVSNDTTSVTTLSPVGRWDPGTRLNITQPVLFTVAQLSTAPSDIIDCPPFNVGDQVAGTCSPCPDSSYFDTPSSTCVPCPSGYGTGADQVSCVPTSGLVAAIVIIVVLGIALIVGVIVVVVRRQFKKMREAEMREATAPAETWPADTERQETSKFDDVLHHSTIAETGLAVAAKSGDDLSFGVSKGTRMPINVDLADVLAITNQTGKTVSYTVYVPDGAGAFTCQATPGRGVVKAHAERQVSISFKLLQTMKLDRHVKVQFDGEVGAVYFTLRFEGEVSLRIDPDEIELVGEAIGSGAFGTVYRGRYRGTLCAVKVLRRQQDLKAEQAQAFVKEMELLQKLRNPYIVNFVGGSYIPNKLCLCTELLERGSVLDLMRKAKLSLMLKVKFMHDAARAVEFLHENGVVYRDLKPDNLLVFSVAHKAAVNCKLSDFGTARSVEDRNAVVKYTTGVGTPIYMAPELMNESPYNCQIDVYSLGMVMWELLAERHPFFEVKRVWDVPRLVVEGMRPAFKDSWPEALRDLIGLCWLQSAERRPQVGAVAASLAEFYERERDTYEEGKTEAVAKKKKKKEDGGSSSNSTTPTANTGRLEQLIEQSKVEPRLMTNELQEIKNRAADVTPIDDADADADADAKPADAGEEKKDEGEKRKKKKKAATSIE